MICLFGLSQSSRNDPPCSKGSSVLLYYIKQMRAYNSSGEIESVDDDVPEERGQRVRSCPTPCEDVAYQAKTVVSAVDPPVIVSTIWTRRNQSDNEREQKENIGSPRMRKDPVGTSSEGNDVNGNARSWLMAGEAYKRVDLAKGNRKSAFRRSCSRSALASSDAMLET